VNYNKGNYKTADSLFSNVIQMDPKGIKADNSMIYRARIYDNVFNDKEKAIELYQKILIDYSGSIYVNEARSRFNNLKD
jgi:TolA-binding protein